MQTAYLKHKKTFWKQVGRDIKNVSNPFFSLKVRIRCTCTFQENYLFELILKILSQWRSHQLLRQCALLALCLKQKYFILSNLYIPCNLSSLLKSWTLLNHYQGSKRAFFFPPLFEYFSLQWINHSQFIQSFLIELATPYSLLFPEDFCGCWFRQCVGIFP